jgi:hypothetical protein
MSATIRLLAAALLGGFLLSACTEEKQRLSANVEDCRGKTCEAIKPKTAYLLNGLGVYSKPGMMGAIALLLEDEGYKVTILNHTDGKRLTSMPDVLVGHSMGANAALKRSQIFRKNPPKLIVSIDAGRAPLFSRAHPTTRTVSIYCPLHPIGGQAIEGATNIQVCGTAHIAMPHDRRVLKIIKDEVRKL